MKKLMSKKLTKALLLTACALVLVCATVMGTVAYLTATKTVTNTFTYGNVAITMSDAEITDKLVPGKPYTKDTTIHVEEGSEDCYLFAKAESVDTITYNFANNWVQIGDTGVYYYKEIAKAGDDVDVLENFIYSVDAENPNGEETANETITGYAVQVAGFADQEAAWKATFGKTATPQS